MKELSSLLQQSCLFVEDAPKHDKAASVNEIMTALYGSDFKTKKVGRYGYGYWLKKIGDRPYSSILGLVKKMNQLPNKYNKGGWLTNQLK